MVAGTVALGEIIQREPARPATGPGHAGAIVAGQRDPKALAQLARGSMRGKIRRLEEALDCSFFTAEHAAVLAMMLATIDHYTAQIAALTENIETLIEPYLSQVGRRMLQLAASAGLRPGHHRRDRHRHDGVPHPHLVSAAKWSPQVTQSAGKRPGSNATGRGNPHLSAALGEAAIGASRTQSFLGARYRQMARRMPKEEALVATGDSVLTMVHALLSDPAASYADLGADYYEQRMHARRQARNHVRSLERPATRSPSRPSTPTPANSRPTAS